MAKRKKKIRNLDKVVENFHPRYINVGSKVKLRSQHFKIRKRRYYFNMTLLELISSERDIENSFMIRDKHCIQNDTDDSAFIIATFTVIGISYKDNTPGEITRISFSKIFQNRFDLLIEDEDGNIIKVDSNMITLY